MSKTGFFIIGKCLGAIQETRGDQNQFVNYRFGISVEGEPDQFGQVQDETIVVSLTPEQFTEFGVQINSAIGKPVRVPVRTNVRYGVTAKNKAWGMLDIYLPRGMQPEILSPQSTVSQLPEGVKAGAK